jgi:exosome complex RNA-binding protein Rrp42 (RNase PH superfamily)
MISKSEFDFIFKGIQANIRSDGRTALDTRNVTLKTNTNSQASGINVIIRLVKAFLIQN